MIALIKHILISERKFIGMIILNAQSLQKRMNFYSLELYSYSIGCSFKKFATIDKSERSDLLKSLN